MDIVDSEGAQAEASAAKSGAGRKGAVDGSSSLGGPVDVDSMNDSAAISSENTAAPASRRDVEIDVNTDETPEPPNVVVHSAGVRSSDRDPSATDDGTIEVSDEEIETAEPALLSAVLAQTPRQGLQPPPSSAGVMRSRPPAPPPSSRPRPRASSSLPPPLHLSNGSSRSPGVDPWLLANKTLELSHAHARIAELEEQVAFRDARIIELEDSLAKARRKLEDIEARRLLGAPAPMAAADALQSIPVTLTANPGPSLVTETRPVAAARIHGADGRLAAVAREGDDEASVDQSEASFGARDTRFGSGAASAVGRGGSDDDLQQISGIGPRFEAALRRHGVTRLSQIAAWSEADVRQVAKALKIPKSRIVKGRWVEVAREVIGTRAASE